MGGGGHGSCWKGWRVPGNTIHTGGGGLRGAIISWENFVFKEGGEI